MYSILTSSPVFNGYNESELKILFKKIDFSVNRYPAGTLIVSRGDEVKAMHIIIKGKVKAEMQDFGGKILEVGVIAAPRPIAPGFVYGPKNRFPVDGSAFSDVEILSITKSSFSLLLREEERVMMNFTAALSNKIQFLTHRVWFFSFNTIKEKLAHYILDAQENGELQFRLDKSQRELAEFFGVSRPALGRVFSELQKDGIIEYSYGMVNILRREKLISIVRN